MADKQYAFVDRRCPVCGGNGLVNAYPNGIGTRSCLYCRGFGIVGEYEEVPQVIHHGPCALAWRLRKTRESRQVGMDALSKIFGMTVVRLSDIERGCGEEITGRERMMIANWIYGGNKKMKAMLSQPMAGKSDQEIAETRERAIIFLEAQGYEVVNTLFTDEWYAPDAMKERGVENIPLCFLAKSLENMSKCHVAYFCKGWEQARGCRIEHEAAKAYGMKILYEELPQEQLENVPRTYIGVKRIKALPQEKDGLPGYNIFYQNGHQKWCPKHIFERIYLPIARPDKLTQEDIDTFLAIGTINAQKWGEKTTVCEFVLPTGWTELESSSCVDPKNFDMKLGTNICCNNMRTKLWRYLGFILQWADHGLQQKSITTTPKQE